MRQLALHQEPVSRLLEHILTREVYTPGFKFGNSVDACARLFMYIVSISGYLRCAYACTYRNTLSLLLSSMGSRAKMFCSRGEAANVRWSQGECADAQFRSKSSFRAQAFLVFTEALNFTSVVCRSSSMLRGVATARYETCPIVSHTCAHRVSHLCTTPLDHFLSKLRT